MAEDRGLPSNWLNGNAAMWMPPLPEHVLESSPEPGLHVTYASDEFLFATKLIAQRRKDADDLRVLSQRLGLLNPSAEQLEAVIRRYYTDTGSLELIVGGGDLDTEVRLLAHDAAAMLATK